MGGFQAKQDRREWAKEQFNSGGLHRHTGVSVFVEMKRLVKGFQGHRVPIFKGCGVFG